MHVYINNVEYKVTNNWSIGEKAGNPSDSSFQILIEDQNVPTAGDTIIVTDDNDNRLFLGFVGIPKSPVFKTGNELMIYTVTCNGANSVTKNRIVNRAYANKTITEIVNALYSDYIQGEGITLGTVSEIEAPVLETYNCKNMSLMTVLNELAEYVGASWHITVNGVFDFVVHEDFPYCSKGEITENNAPITIQQSESNKDLRTVQIIECNAETDAMTENFVMGDMYADDDAWEGFSLRYAVSTNLSISINGVDYNQYVGIDAEDIDYKMLFLAKTGDRFIQANPDGGKMEISSSWSGSFQNTSQIFRARWTYTGDFNRIEVSINGDAITDITQLSGMPSIDGFDSQYLLGWYMTRNGGETQFTVVANPAYTGSQGLNPGNIGIHVVVGLPWAHIEWNDAWYGKPNPVKKYTSDKTLYGNPRIFIDTVECTAITELDSNPTLEGFSEYMLFGWRNTAGGSEIIVNPAYSGDAFRNAGNIEIYYRWDSYVSAGDEIEVVYKGSYPARISYGNDDAIENIHNNTGWSGVIENLLVDDTIKTQEDAKTKAEALLDNYGLSEKKLTVSIDFENAIKHGFAVSDFDIYTQWVFNAPRLHIVGNYVLTEKQITPLIIGEDYSYVMKLTFSDRNFVKSYGEIVSSLYKNYAKLTVREDSFIIDNRTIREVCQLGEELAIERVIANYVSGSVMENGQIATPIGTLYPYLVS